MNNMAKMVFKVDGGGDSSVGIWDTHATVTIEDNYREIDKEQLELFREFLREFYDIPKHMGSVLTLEEWNEREDAESLYWESMREDEGLDKDTEDDTEVELLKNKEKRFTRKAEELGYEVELYSGRGMFGRECPSVTVDNPNDFISEIGMKGLKIDNMGLQYVVYTG